MHILQMSPGTGSQLGIFDADRFTIYTRCFALSFVASAVRLGDLAVALFFSLIIY